MPVICVAAETARRGSIPPSQIVLGVNVHIASAQSDPVPPPAPPVAPIVQARSCRRAAGAPGAARARAGRGARVRRRAARARSPAVPRARAPVVPPRRALIAAAPVMCPRPPGQRCPSCCRAARRPPAAARGAGRVARARRARGADRVRVWGCSCKRPPHEEPNKTLQSVCFSWNHLLGFVKNVLGQQREMRTHTRPNGATKPQVPAPLQQNSKAL